MIPPTSKEVPQTTDHKLRACWAPLGRPLGLLTAIPFGGGGCYAKNLEGMLAIANSQLINANYSNVHLNSACLHHCHPDIIEGFPSERGSKKAFVLLDIEEKAAHPPR